MSLSYARTLSSATLFGVAASFMLRSWRLGWFLTLSLGLHELGHVSLLQRYSVNWEIRFGIFGAATVTPRDQRQRLEHLDNALIHLAGPAVSLMQALLAYVVHGTLMLFEMAELGRRVGQLGNLAALIVLINLMPLGKLSDGGKALRRIFASLLPRAETELLWVLLFWLGALIWLAAILWGDPARLITTLAFAAWFVVGTLVERRRDNPDDADIARAMTHRQTGILFGAIGASLIVSIAIFVSTPFWLSSQDATRIARAYAGLLANLTAYRTAVLIAVLLGASLIIGARLVRRRLPQEDDS